MEAMSYMTLGGGAAAEMFDRELEKVLANIYDPNRPYKQPRKITLELTLRPDENRDKVGVSIAVSSKAPGFKSFDSLAYLGFDQRDRTKPRAYERAHPDQQRLSFMVPEPQDIPDMQTSEERKTHA